MKLSVCSKKSLLLYITLSLFILSCGNKEITSDAETEPDFILAFGSCNIQDEPQPLWEPILANNPDAFVWGGDNIYADTRDMDLMQSYYELQENNPGYKKLTSEIEVLGTWDDHDYGINDGGNKWEFKEESQQLFLDFMKVPDNDQRRAREGIYHSKVFKTDEGGINLIILDTRYFRDELADSKNKDKRYDAKEEGTMLGEEQWKWLEKELNTSKAEFNVIVSSIQFLSSEHGFETWGNLPKEQEKLTSLITNSGASNVIILSGDRHISEFSEVKLTGLNYPLIDFTSSGLTHTYTEFSGEPNQHRVGKVINDLSFGVLKFDFSKKQVEMEMRGENNRLLQTHTGKYSNIKR